MATKEPDRHTDRNLKARYGISEEDYNAMLEDQKGRCGICHRFRKLSVDHCHSTNKVRGLLCSNCNAAIGMFDERPGFLQQAIDYLNTHA
jgi:Recombination endonuclease VII